MFFYRVYKHSFLATIINVMFRLIAFLVIISTFTVFNDENRVLQILIIAIGIAFWFIGNAVGDAIAAKAEEKFQSQNHNMESKLCPYEVEENTDTQGEEFSLPATLSIKRDNAFMGRFGKVKFIVNGQTYEVKNDEKVDISTVQKDNMIKIKNCMQEPFQVGVEPGETVILHFKAVTLVSIERIYRDGSKSQDNFR